LASAAASTTFVAGDKVSIPHYLFCGVTAAVAPNRSLYVRAFSESVVFVGFTTLSGCTPFSARNNFSTTLLALTPNPQVVGRLLGSVKSKI